MNGVLKEWLDKAEGDYIVALREYRARKNPNYDAVWSANKHNAKTVVRIMKRCRQEIRAVFTRNGGRMSG